MDLIERYKRYVMRLSEDDQYNHFNDAMDYFRGKDDDWFKFARYARGIVKNGEPKSSRMHIGHHSVWEEARAVIRHSAEFKTFAEALLEPTEPQQGVTGDAAESSA